MKIEIHLKGSIKGLHNNVRRVEEYDSVYDDKSYYIVSFHSGIEKEYLKSEVERIVIVES